MLLMRRGRIAKWSKEQIDKLSTPELRALLENAERLKEAEVAALCNELLDSRPRGRPSLPRAKHARRGLVTRAKAFAQHGVVPRSRIWSRGGVKDGAVVFVLAAAEMQKNGSAESYLLWAPNTDNAHPWSDTPAGKERLEHCHIALERGMAEGLLIYGDNGAKTNRVDAERVLTLTIEKRGEEYWATRAPQKR